VGFLAGQVIALLVAQAAASLAGSHRSLIEISNLAAPPWWFVASSLVGLWIGFLLTAAVVQRRYRPIALPAVFRARWSDVRFIALGVGLQALVDLVYWPLHLKETAAQSHKLVGGAAGWEFVLLALMTIVGAPIVEEIFFRGVVLNALRALSAAMAPRGALAAAVVGDGVLFGLAHGELALLPALAVVGAVLALVYARSGRLVPAIVTHASFNAYTLVAIAIQRSH
jgi:hypothetical protein